MFIVARSGQTIFCSSELAAQCFVCFVSKPEQLKISFSGWGNFCSLVSIAGGGEDLVWGGESSGEERRTALTIGPIFEPTDKPLCGDILRGERGLCLHHRLAAWFNLDSNDFLRAEAVSRFSGNHFIIVMSSGKHQIQIVTGTTLTATVSIFSSVFQELW